MQPQPHLLVVALGIQRQQPCQHVVAHGIGPAVTPGQPTAALYRAAGAELTLEVEGITCIPEEQLAAVLNATIDALLQVIGELGVVFGVEVIEADASVAGLLSDGPVGPSVGPSLQP